jgi:hypothetical protein
MRKEPAKAAPQSINFTKIASAGHGHVKSIREGSEYGDVDDSGLAEVTVHHGPKEKPKPTKSNQAMPYKESKTSRVHIPAAHAKKLKIGQKVRIHLEGC